MAEQKKEVNKLGGLNLRQERADLQEHELAISVNADPFQEPGALVIRHGKFAQLPQLNDSIVRTLAKVNANRYEVAGRNIYHKGTQLTRDDLSTELQTTIEAFRPLNDTSIWAFIADDALMVKDNGTNLYLWGLDLIPLPAPKVANQTGKLASDTITEGVYKIAVTQIRWDLNG